MALNKIVSNSNKIQSIQPQSAPAFPWVRLIQGCEIVVLLLLIFQLPGTNVYQETSPKAQPVPIEFLPIEVPQPLPFPVRITDMKPPEVTAKSVQITDELSKEVLYAKNADTPLPPASLAKLMTALITLDYCNKDKILPATFTPIGSDESRMGLKAGENISVEAALYGLLLPSGNDAALVLANNCTPQVTSFTALAKAKGVLLGLKHTNFTNPTGQDAPQNVTTAHDLTLLSFAALANPLITDIVKTPYKVVYDASGRKAYILNNTNILLGRNGQVIGLKTGTTDNAGQNFIAYATAKEDRKIVLVVLGSSDRFQEVVRLLGWVKETVVWKLPAPIPDYRSDFP